MDGDVSELSHVVLGVRDPESGATWFLDAWSCDAIRAWEDAWTQPCHNGDSGDAWDYFSSARHTLEELSALRERLDGVPTSEAWILKFTELLTPLVQSCLPSTQQRIVALDSSGSTGSRPPRNK